MSVSDISIRPRIIKSAKQEFLRCGYKKASLQSICKKAGVTTGAFYKRFSGKAELFEAILSPTVQLIYELSQEHDRENRELMKKDIAGTRWETAAEVQHSWMDFLYQHFDEMKLILSRAEGTEYEYFLEDFVHAHTRLTLLKVEDMKKVNRKVKNVYPDELYILYKGFWTAFFEPIVQDFPKEKAHRFIETLAVIFYWNIVFWDL